MISQKNKILSNYLYVVDLFFIVAAYFIAYITANIIDPFIVGFGLLPLYSYIWMLIPIAVIFYFYLIIFSFHKDLFIRKNIAVQFLKSFELTFAAILTFYGILFMLRLHYVSRLFIGYFAIYVFLFLVISNYISKKILKIFKQRDYSLRTILIVGDIHSSEKIEKTIKKNEYLGLKSAGIINKDNIRIIPDFVIKNPVDEVIFDVNENDLNGIKELTLLLEEMGITVKIVTKFIPFKYSKISFEKIDDLPMLSFYTAPEDEILLLIKRFIDIIGSLAGIILFFIPSIIIAILIKFSSKGHIIYKSKRVGLHGRLFTFYKFRTMIETSDAMREELRKKFNPDGIEVKLKDDPRLTWIGKILRKTSLDELPQFYNVLRGDMSIVGPRPPMPDEVAKYSIAQRRRLSMKPGITCLWQISGRSRLSFEDRVVLDLKYIDNWSLKLDFIILFKTIPAVIFAHGAM
ncbi:MAG: sugar transferase [Candidatus Acididesulfobacter guangdongensis]|uniref:Sugar transferase n=1 Tax=Acididesulfobacter guangdongensis TaxID=2597225 RepID=A0A519BF13_ACIG2|nr:MAG: sugar transferase [Candidatus Acididesulfobacter guangdongensis]